MYITGEDPAPIYSKYDDEFTFENGIHLKPTASNYAIKAYLLQEAIYKRVKGDNQIINYMIKEFKKLDIYNLKSESERKETISFLKDNSNIYEILKEDSIESNEDLQEELAEKDNNKIVDIIIM